MRDVVLDEVRLRAERGLGDAEALRQRRLGSEDLPEVRGPLGRHLPAGAVLQGVDHAASEVRAGVPGQGEVVDVRGSETRGLEAVADRAVGKRGVVLDAGEALFLDRGHEAAVDDERR